MYYPYHAYIYIYDKYFMIYTILLYIENRFCLCFVFSSAVLNCQMKFSVFVPGNLEGPAPVLYHLSGMLCSEQTFVQRSGFQRWAAHYGIIVVAPDVAPSTVILGFLFD